MIDYLTHYYPHGRLPFRSLSALPDCEALRLMELLCDETIFGARFKDPAWYLQARRQTEMWVREQFIAKGGRPVEAYPVYMVLGSSRWISGAKGIETPGRNPGPALGFPGMRCQLHLSGQHDLALVRQGQARASITFPSITERFSPAPRSYRSSRRKACQRKPGRPAYRPTWPRTSRPRSGTCSRCWRFFLVDSMCN